MSDSDNNGSSQIIEKGEVTQFNPEAPKSKISAVLEELELFALQKDHQNNIDFGKLNDPQKDKIIGILEKNEQNAYDYHTKRLDTIKEIEIKRIDASIVNQKTLKILIIGLIIAVPVITLLILFFKESFFIPWLTFLTGILGGIGISKIVPAIYKPPPKDSPLDKDSE